MNVAGLWLKAVSVERQARHKEARKKDLETNTSLSLFLFVVLVRKWEGCVLGKWWFDESGAECIGKDIKKRSLV